ncbi:SPOR domain-containing protein [Polynucleobacter sp. AP-Kaivos-20-H2]|uniref:SPOR domain-containing protein n=1 Tax=Polynucleobacter sp. AP-Kaivos-20-H2 TaxID=2689104 RepID=UPI001C0E581C|nr:SPOR domain-containing protein [Polynucleobacter sp. AP-Kaivos-20-H2]
MKYLIAILLLSTQLVFAQNADSEKQGVVGVRYTKNADGMIVIKYVEHNSPAAQAGIQVNDIMISVDGSSLKGMDPGNIKNMLRGKVGSTAEIKLENSQTKNEYSVSVVRKIVRFGADDGSKDSLKKTTVVEASNADRSEAAIKASPPKTTTKPPEKIPTATTPLAATQNVSTLNPEKASANPSSDSKYFIQTGAFFTKEIANDQVAAFNQKGYTSFVDPAKINGSNVFRVRIGPLPTQQSAEAISKKLASQGISASIIEASKN